MNHLRLQAAPFDDALYRDTLKLEAGAMFGPPHAGGEPLHRYALWRNWETPLAPAPKRILWICLNPSTADERKLDPSVRRMVRFSEAWGYGGMYLVNLFAYRSPYPEALGDTDDPVGSWNDRITADLAERCDAVLCAWGTLGVMQARDRVVLDILERTQAPRFCLERTKFGHPKHPLYVSGDKRPQTYTAERTN